MIGYRIEVAIDFASAIERVKEELKKEGFGVLTEINVKDTLKEKIGVDFDDYVILGACNPNLAYEVLKLHKSVGLLLPCNVLVYSENDRVFVEVIDPVEALKVIGSGELEEFAKNAKKNYSEQ